VPRAPDVLYTRQDIPKLLNSYTCSLRLCLLGIDIYMSYSLNDIMEIRYIKCNRSEQVYEFNSFGMSCLVDNTSGARGTDLPPPLFSNFLFTNLFSIKFLYFFIISSLFPYFIIQTIGHVYINS
jgi:hypothetical protein